jgi:hypothetical protein
MKFLFDKGSVIIDFDIRWYDVSNRLHRKNNPALLSYYDERYLWHGMFHRFGGPSYIYKGVETEYFDLYGISVHKKTAMRTKGLRFLITKTFLWTIGAVFSARPSFFYEKDIF